MRKMSNAFDDHQVRQDLIAIGPVRDVVANHGQCRLVSLFRVL
jgi:hypothetical protein